MDCRYNTVDFRLILRSDFTYSKVELELTGTLNLKRGFSITVRVFRNVTPEQATTKGIHEQLKKINTTLGDIAGIKFLTESAFTNLDPVENTIYYTRPG